MVEFDESLGCKILLRLLGVDTPRHVPKHENFVNLQKGMSPVKQVLAGPDGLASEVPAWFATYMQETDNKFAEQQQIIEQQGKEINQRSEEIQRLSRTIQRLSRTIHGYENIEVRKLKGSGR